MTNLENYLFSAFIFLVLCVLFYLWKARKKKITLSAQQKYTLETLQLARSQHELFDLKLLAGATGRHGISALLKNIDKDGLKLEVNGTISNEWLNKPVEAYFRVRRDEEPVFYVFSSLVKRVQTSSEKSSLLLVVPIHLRVEKKRHFMRVQPPREDIRAISVWPIHPGGRLPVDPHEFGKPLAHFARDMKEVAVEVENISGGGMALRFILDNPEHPPKEFNKGHHLLCVLTYALDSNSNESSVFWCTGEIMSSRVTEGGISAVVIGLEFTNCAVLHYGENEIHWAHCSPSRGARPILKWVEHIDRKARPPIPESAGEGLEMEDTETNQPIN